MCDSRTKDAKQFLNKYKRLDAAVDAFYTDPDEFARSTPNKRGDTEKKLTALFERYKGASTDELSCAD